MAHGVTEATEIT